jgi:hypothetical protein
MSDSGFDPKRRLCPDGTCTGVIGPDGRCRECGRAAGASPRASGAAATATVVEPDDGDEDAAALDAAGGDAPVAGGPGFDPNRRLCDDGSCVGVIGPDGRCTVCGLQAA